MNALLTRLQMAPISDLFDKYYEEAKQEQEVPPWLSKDYILAALNEFPFLTTTKEIVLTALPEVLKHSDLVLFAQVLYLMLGLRKHQKEVFGGLKFPVAPEGECTLGYDLIAVFPLLARIREAYAALLDQGADPDILFRTASGVDDSVSASFRIAGKPALSVHYFLWLTTQSNGALFHIGRFEFEVRKNCRQPVFAFANQKGNLCLLAADGLCVHKSGLIHGSVGTLDESGTYFTKYRETDASYIGHRIQNGLIEPEAISLSKEVWRLAYEPGDALISIHIPENGPFDPCAVTQSLMQGKKFLCKLYPEHHFKGFMCISWLLSTELADVLYADSNILKFGDRFIRYPVFSKGCDVFRFVFQHSVSDPHTVDLDCLNTNTSLGRNLIEYYRNGNYIHEMGGLIIF